MPNENGVDVPQYDQHGNPIMIGGDPYLFFQGPGGETVHDGAPQKWPDNYVDFPLDSLQIPKP